MLLMGFSFLFSFFLGIIKGQILQQESQMIPSYLPKRVNLIPLGNEHGLSNTCDLSHCGDFHLAVYYLNPGQMLVHIRRLDDMVWSFNVTIYVYGSDFKDQFYPKIRTVYSLGPSDNYHKEIILNSTIPLFSDDSINITQKIPKVIIQTFSSRYVDGINQWNAYHTFVELNPEYEIFMFNDRDCREFLKKYFSHKFVEAYDSLISPTFKSDLFRYSYLAVFGGCYFDHKMILRQPLRNILFANDTLILCSDALPDSGFPPPTLSRTQRLYNAIICSQAQDARIWMTLNHVLNKIETKYYQGNDLSLTGPEAFYQAIKNNITEDNIRLTHGFRIKSISSIKRKYEDYYVLEKVTNRLFVTKAYRGFLYDSKMRYGNLWLAGQIYYHLLFYYSPWKIFSLPGQEKCFRGFMQDGWLVLSLLHASREFDLQHLPMTLKKCRRIILYFLNDETSQEINLEIPSSVISNNQNQYTVPFDFKK